MKKLLALLLIAPSLYAAQTCTVIDVTGFTSDQIILGVSLANEIGLAAGTYNGTPTATQSGSNVSVCFDTPSFDVVATITRASMVAQYQADNASRVASQAQSNVLAIELSTTTAAAQSAWASFGSLTAGQKDAALKGLLRIFDLRKQLRID